MFSNTPRLNIPSVSNVFLDQGFSAFGEAELGIAEDSGFEVLFVLVNFLFHVETLVRKKGLRLIAESPFGNVTPCNSFLSWIPKSRFRISSISCSRCARRLLLSGENLGVWEEKTEGV